MIDSIENRRQSSQINAGRLHFSDQKLFLYLNDAADDGYLSTSMYERYREDYPDAPTVRTLHLRFGSWNQALKAAGLLVHHGRGGPPTQYPPEACIAAMRLCEKDLKALPSVQTYERWRKQTHRQDEVPSSATIRGRWGSWMNALEELAGADV